ncbi:MAG: 4Fe-4S dicluster domain-containing protein [Armatimonadota bacterium]
MRVSRRNWLKAAGSVGAGVGISASGAQKLIPYVFPPQDVVPGLPTWYATTCRECPAGCGMLVRCREGRAVKVEGNPDHPINRGRLCARGQAALQGLYDPDRVNGPLRAQGGDSTQPGWEEALASLGEPLRALRGTGRVAIITDLQTGALTRLVRQWLAAFGSPPEHHLVFEPLSYAALRRGTGIAFGRDAIPAYGLGKADFVLSLSADFLETWLSPVRNTRQFAAMREVRGGRMGRCVYVGPRLSLTAANADERFWLRPGHEAHLALAMLHVAAREGWARRAAPLLERLTEAHSPESVGPIIGVAAESIRHLARAFAKARRPVALAGSPYDETPEAVQTVVAANLLNYAVGSQAVDFGREHALGACADASRLEDFTEAVTEGGVEVLLVCGANPLYALPPGHDLVRFITEEAQTVVSLSSCMDETAAAADWVVPASHPLESWGDYEPETGVRGIIQPAMVNLFDTRSAGDILLLLAQAAGVHVEAGLGAADFREYLRAEWRELHERLAPEEDFEAFWTESVRRGGHWSEAAPKTPELDSGLADFAFSPPRQARGISIHAYPSTALYDGRGANKGWLQELPDPVTNAVWGSWVDIPEEEARQQGISRGDIVEVSSSSGTVRAPAVPCPALAPETIAVPLGQGHTSYGRNAEGAGANALPMVAFVTGNELLSVTISRAGARQPAVTTAGSSSQHGREIIRTVGLSRVDREAEEELYLPLPEGYDLKRDLYPPHEHAGHRWAMVIDLNRCTGCGACVVACYAENNIPVVGRAEVAKGREMAWLRIERYFDWGSDQAPMLFLPMLCQHCDSAPCEPVCPVYAAVHSEDGLNAQVYNRCVGTRYCANNCPYKARRFNWFDHDWPEPLNWQLNPEVTVRCRGVMEKCTFCVQRIREGEQRAKAQNRRLRDGDIVPACAQTCPAEAMVFGDLMDSNSQVSRLVREDPRCYQVLGELNTKPAVIYLKRLLHDREAGEGTWRT